MKNIAILLSTYNGGKYLEDQLCSLESQSAEKFHIYIRDDGSNDNTKEIILKFIQRYKNCTLLESNNNLGAANSFMEMLLQVKADYYMFCDQDDIWLKDKIMNSYNYLKAIEDKKGIIPLLVFTDAKVVDANLNTISDSFIKTSGIRTDFINNKGYVLIKNISPGCTYIFNRKLRDQAISYNSNLPMHDWWLVLKAIKTGEIHYFETSDILYRQHDHNVIGVQENNLKLILNKFININKTLKLQFSQYSFLKNEDLIDNYATYMYYKVKYVLKTWFT